jgi:hypothetical protein
MLSRDDTNVSSLGKKEWHMASVRSKMMNYYAIVS